MLAIPQQRIPTEAEIAQLQAQGNYDKALEAVTMRNRAIPPLNGSENRFTPTENRIRGAEIARLLQLTSPAPKQSTTTPPLSNTEHQARRVEREKLVMLQGPATQRTTAQLADATLRRQARL